MAEQELTTEELATEEWRNSPIYPAQYSVSNLGRVRRIIGGQGSRTNHLLKPRPTKDGHVRVALSRNHQRIDIGVHQLVAGAFLGPCPLGYEVNHKFGQPSNNRTSNLEYMTHLNNVQHAHTVLNAIIPTRARGAKNGRHLHPESYQGSRNGSSKLTEAKVLEIRRLRAAGLTLQTIADRFAVSNGLIAQIALRKIWTHV